MTRDRTVGVGYILLSALGFGFLALFSRMAVDMGGATVWGALLVRFALASLCLGGWVLFKRLPLPRGKSLGVLVGMGAVGYFGQSSTYFLGVKHAPVAVVALLLYLFPVFVAILSRVLLKEPLGGRKLAAMALAMIGAAATLGVGALENGGLPLGGLFGALAGLIYSGYIVAGRFVAEEVDPISQAAVVCFSAFVIFLLTNLTIGFGLPTVAVGWLGAILAALVCTVLAVAAFLAGLKRVSANDAAILSCVEPVVTVLTGAAFLHEPLTGGVLVGGGLILVAALLILKSS